MPGSRSGGALQEYTGWTEPEIPALTSSQFPFILDRQAQQHQDLGEYQSHEARDREWTAAQRATREYERGFLREGWQRRWEPCSPVRYNREVSKRTDSSYRELEAWAARYSHSLPRRRRIEAELRGSSQLLERTDPRAATLQHVRQSANRESGLWDRSVRQQAPTYYPPQVPAPDTSHVLDIKEKAGYQRRMFSQPPGYIAPPPYNSPLKGSPLTHHCDPSWEQEGKRQTYWSQPTLRKQDMYDKKPQKPEGNQKSFSELEGLKHQRQEAASVQAESPISIQNTQIQHECLQQPQTVQAVQNTKINEETSSKVIEGRKFRLNKKTGGLTIFCLVSRIAGTTETPSLPLRTSQTIIQNTEVEEVSKGLRSSGDVNQMLADEVDFRAQTLTEQSNTQHTAANNLTAKQTETPTSAESEILVESLSNKDDTDVVSPERTNEIDEDSAFARQVAQSVPPLSVKYPLWRQPSFTSKVNSEETASDVQNTEDCAEDGSRPVDGSEDSKSLLVIDTTCVVVKMELIPSPKKEHVHFLDSTSQPNQDVASDQNAETKPLQMNESLETELDSDLVEKKALEVESEIPFSCLSSSPVSERETLEERAERILGIPLQDRVAQQQPEDTTSLQLCVEDQDEGVESSPMQNNAVNDEDDTKEEEQPQNLLEHEQTEDAVCLRDENKDLVENEDFTGRQEQQSNTDCHSGADTNNVQESEIIEDLLLEEENTSSQDPLSVSDSSPSSSVDCEEPNAAVALELSPSDLTSFLCISESNTEEDPDPELVPQPETLSLPQTPPPLPPGSTEASPSSTPRTDHSPSPPHLDLTVPAAEAMPTANLCVEDQVEEGQTSQLIENEVSDAPELLVECEQSKEAACVKESDVTEEQLPKEVDEDPVDLLEQTPELFIEEHRVEFNILQQQSERVEADDYSCGNDTEEQLQKDVREDPTDLLDQTPEISKENVTDSQTEIEVKVVQQQSDDGRAEEALCGKETEEPSQKEDSEDLLDQTQDATDCRAQTDILQVIAPLTEASDSESEVNQMSLNVLSASPQHASNESNTEFVSLLEMASICPSTLHPDEILLDSCEDSLQFLISCPSESAPLLPRSASTPPEEESGSISPDLLHKEEPQYPKSLWDAVNRIRKHTAPDSENEEEEVSELWDPESVGEDLCRPDVVLDLNSEDVMSYCSEAKQETGEMEVFDEAGQQEVSEEGRLQDGEPPGHAEDDTLSCSSTSSRDSGDTVIVAEEGKTEETTSDDGTENKTGSDGEKCCSDEVKHETVAEEEGHETERSVAVQTMDAEQKQTEQEVFTSTEINADSNTGQEKVCESVK